MSASALQTGYAREAWLSALATWHATGAITRDSADHLDQSARRLTRTSRGLSESQRCLDRTRPRVARRLGGKRRRADGDG